MIRESEQQADRRDAVRTFFETKTLRPSTIGQPRPPSAPRPVILRPVGGKTVNQANGKDGSLKFEDSDGAELGKITWKKGKIQEEGDQVITIPRDDASSYPV